MSKPLSVQRPGLKQKAKDCKRLLTNLYNELADTTGTHTTLSTHLATARTDVDTLITDIDALT